MREFLKTGTEHAFLLFMLHRIEVQIFEKPHLYHSKTRELSVLFLTYLIY